MASKTNTIKAINEMFSLVSRDRCMTNFKKISVPKYRITPKETASVLVPLCKVSNVPSLLYTIRHSELKASNGEVAFPGGRSKTGEDAVQTALRETEEEIGLSHNKIEVWGKGPAIPGRNNTILITPVIGSLIDLKQTDLKVDSQEVSEVFTVPVVSLCDQKNQFYTQFTNGFILPVFVVEDYKIWGITAYITHAFLSSALTKDVYTNEWMKKKIVLNKL